jgi:hypothetical protein
MGNSEYLRNKLSNNSPGRKDTEKDLDREESPIRYRGEITTINYDKERKNDFSSLKSLPYLGQFPSSSHTRIRYVRRKLDNCAWISSQGSYSWNRSNYPDMVSVESSVKKFRPVDMRQQFEHLISQFEAKSEEIENQYGENYVLFKDDRVMYFNSNEEALYKVVAEKDIAYPFLIQKASLSQETYEIVTPFED